MRMIQDAVTITGAAAQDSNNTTKTSADTDGIHVLDLIADMISLRNTLDAETRHLKQMNMKAVREMHDYKMKLIRRVEIQKELIQRDPAILIGRSEVSRAELKTIEGQLEISLKENFNEVLKAKEVNRRVVEAIARAVNQHRRSATGYTNNGASADSVAAAYSRQDSVALNQII